MSIPTEIYQTVLLILIFVAIALISMGVWKDNSENPSLPDQGPSDLNPILPPKWVTEAWERDYNK